MYRRRFRFSTDQSAPWKMKSAVRYTTQTAAAAKTTVRMPLQTLGNRFLRTHSAGDWGSASGATSTTGPSGASVSS
jgi:hypothetical protein